MRNGNQSMKLQNVFAACPGFYEGGSFARLAEATPALACPALEEESGELNFHEAPALTSWQLMKL